MDELKKKIMDVIGKPHLASLATVTGDGKPWTRYVFPVASDDLTIRFSTFLGARKVAQIKENPEVHLTCGVSDPGSWQHYLQIQGRAELVTDEAEKKAFWNDTISRIFSGPDDPKYAVIRVIPYRIEVNTMGSFEPEVWEA
ncbi:MAG TPA: pyridoxamine 5'-phosphate oxidase family protein [Candidatus Krumholzibacterium sp.]|nr:pyridoxamine 5'-phosphate oxidase family protein [Candidatus Krumholzibacterium sp.]